jgi:hypothetical protein
MSKPSPLQKSINEISGLIFCNYGNASVTSEEVIAVLRRSRFAGEAQKYQHWWIGYGSELTGHTADGGTLRVPRPYDGNWNTNATNYKYDAAG